MSSAAQINANRANSQFSTGPTTDAGKAKSSHNAVKSALTGETILLPTDDVPAYEKLAQALIDLHRPAAYQEEILVQSLIDTEWRARLPCRGTNCGGVPSLRCSPSRLFNGESSTCQIPAQPQKRLSTLISANHRDGPAVS